MSVCTNQDEINEILESSLGEVFSFMKNAVEKSDDIEREWTFNYTGVTFTVKVELKGDGVAE